MTNQEGQFQVPPECQLSAAVDNLYRVHGWEGQTPPGNAAGTKTTATAPMSIGRFRAVRSRQSTAEGAPDRLWRCKATRSADLRLFHRLRW
jgi:hypothetical protein